MRAIDLAQMQAPSSIWRWWSTNRRHRRPGFDRGHRRTDRRRIDDEQTATSRRRSRRRRIIPSSPTPALFDDVARGSARISSPAKPARKSRRWAAISSPMSAACRCAAKSFPARVISRSKCRCHIPASGGCALPQARSEARARAGETRRREATPEAVSRRPMTTGAAAWAAEPARREAPTASARSAWRSSRHGDAAPHQASRRRAVSADGAVQCLAGAIRDLSGIRLIDGAGAGAGAACRRRRWPAGGSASVTSCRTVLIGYAFLVDAPTFAWLRRSRRARLISALPTAIGFARPPDLDPGRFPRDRAGCQPR